jgi:hypothetical protein
MRSAPGAPLVCIECLRADREGDGHGWRADWVEGDEPETLELAEVVGWL